MNLAKKLELTQRATRIFEKEILVFCYFALFAYLSVDEPWNIQLLSFLVGTVLQIGLKLTAKLDHWNNFTAFSFFVIGTAVDYQGSHFSLGFSAYLLLISAFSFAYERWHARMKSGVLSLLLNLVYSAAVISSFPTLYALFLKNKLDIRIAEFVTSDPEHWVVIGGYAVFYVLLLVHKQLVALQNHLLRASRTVPG